MENVVVVHQKNDVLIVVYANIYILEVADFMIEKDKMLPKKRL